MHLDQALRAVKNDCTLAEELRLITAPLKVWMTGGFFDVDRYNASVASSDNSKPAPPTPATTFYTAVKRYSRTLHTVCSPILFCPIARQETLRLRELELIAEEERYKKLAKHVELSQGDIAEEGPRYSSTPLTVDVEVSKRLEERQKQTILRRTRTSSLSTTVTTREVPPWMQEAKDCLLQEFITYMTDQMQFTVIYSTLDLDPNRIGEPYALLQRSVKMAGIHLIEVRIGFVNCLIGYVA